MQTFATNLGFPEAPVPLDDGGLLCVEMAPDRGCITRLGPDGASRSVIASTGRPNGLALDRARNIWVAETAQRALLRLQFDGTVETIATESDGRRFLFLNDLAFAPNGDVYVTDSGILLDEVAPGGEVHPDWRRMRYDGRVYRIDPRTGRAETLDDGIQFTNGLAFGPDGTLYVAETLTGNVYRYDCRDGYARGPRRLFGNVLEQYEDEVLKGPDGMKFAANGDLYCAVFGQGDVTVLGRDGKVARRLPVQGTHPTNLAFAPNGSGLLYVTEVDTGSIQCLQAGIGGLPLHD